MKIDIKRIMAVIGIDVVAITVLYCIFGFTIGGEPDVFTNIPYAIFSVVAVISISLFTFRFITKRAVGEKLPPYLLVGIMIAVHLAACAIYDFSNEFLSTNEYLKYESTVTYIDEYKGRYEIGFTNQAGDEVFVDNSNYSPKINAPVQVEEIPGAFGYSEYYITFEIVE